MTIANRWILHTVAATALAVVALVVTWGYYPIWQQMRHGRKLDTRMRQLGMGLLIYAINNNGVYPADLTALTNVFSNPTLFLAPRSRALAGDMTNIMEWTSYVYVPGARLLPPSADEAASNAWHQMASNRVVLGYLPGVHGTPAFGCLLYLDGHIMAGTAEELTRELNRALSRLAR